MPENLDINNQPFNSDELALLNVVADHIIPSDESRKMPSAADVAYLDSLLENLNHYIPQLKEELQLLDDLSIQQRFVELDQEQQQNILDEQRKIRPDFLYRFAIHIVSCYYHDPRVLVNIGLEARAPYPKGYTEFVKRGDLSLLDPVRARGPIFRPTP